MRILTGNDLKTGAVIWWTGRDWSLHVEDAADVGEHGEAVLAAEDGARRVEVGLMLGAGEMRLHALVDLRMESGAGLERDLVVGAGNPGAHSVAVEQDEGVIGFGCATEHGAGEIGAVVACFGVVAGVALH